MLTRLKVSGFKNLVDVDVRFGPFNCVAGANGVGKSNLFDAIRFLSALAEKPLNEAAQVVRGGENVRSLFHRVGDQYDDEMTFEAEMITPRRGIDDLGQEIEADSTFLRYSLTLGYHEGSEGKGYDPDRLEIRKEELVAISKDEAKQHILFPYKDAWWQSVIRGEKTTSLIYTKNGLIYSPEFGDARIANLIPTTMMPRTMLSRWQGMIPTQFPAIILARHEMRSWRLLQLEPSALRKPDTFAAKPQLDADGSHLPATLYRLAQSDPDPERVYAQVANRLYQLAEDVRSIEVKRIEENQLLTLYAESFDRTKHNAAFLSDGTLRFLALAVLEHDFGTPGLFCLEEPENGIHPGRIATMLKLLQAIAVDTTDPADSDNPLRQVIINTHSPVVVQQVPDNSLIMVGVLHAKQRSKIPRFSVLPDDVNPKTGDVRPNWRVHTPEKPNVAPLGRLLDYLNPTPVHHEDQNEDASVHSSDVEHTVNRNDVEILFPSASIEAE